MEKTENATNAKGGGTTEKERWLYCRGRSRCAATVLLYRRRIASDGSDTVNVSNGKRHGSVWSL